MTLWIPPLPCRNQLTASAFEKAELQSLLLCGTLVIAASVRHAKLLKPSGSLGVCDRFSGRPCNVFVPGLRVWMSVFCSCLKSG